MTKYATDPSWPSTIRLPGQTAAHPGPVDMNMMYVFHHGFRRDLTAFASAAQSTPASDRRTWVALAERWELFSEVLHHHHSGEDNGLWPRLHELTDAVGRETLDAMEAEHGEIDPLLTACAAGFDRLAHHTDEEGRAALAVRLVAARQSLAHHLEHEETEAIAIIQAVLTQAEWERIDEEHFKKGLSFARIVAIVPWALHEMPSAVRNQIFALPGGRLHRLVWQLTHRRFERRERVAFGYLV